MIDKKQLAKDLRTYFAEVKTRKENDLNFLARDVVAVALKDGINKWGNWRRAKRKSPPKEDETENLW